MQVCKVAPVPGETRVWQYITLTKKIYLIDCPGVVSGSGSIGIGNSLNAATEGKGKGRDETSIVLKGVVRVEALETPSEHISALLQRVKPIYISRTYGIPLPPDYQENKVEFRWETEDLLEKLARRMGRLLKGGEPDLESVAKILLMDWVRGRLPFFVPPPEREGALDGSGDSQNEIKPVTQKLSGIIQKNHFEEEDLRPLEEDVVGSVSGKGDEDDEDDIEEEEEEEEDSNSDEYSEEPPDQEEMLDWEDVFEAVTGPSARTTGSSTELEASKGNEAKSASKVQSIPNLRDVGQGDEDEEVNPRKKQKKEPRMTTNKRKATNFFTEANVKNRNREKARVKATLLQASKSGKGRR